MKIIIINMVLLLISNSGIRSCSANDSNGNKLFTIEDATYQSWSEASSGSGTDVIIKLKEVDQNVSFSTLTFRGKTAPVTATSDDGITILKVRFFNDGSIVEADEQGNSDEPDNLKYTFKNAEYRYPLKSIGRLKMNIR
jgi:hypothetical protein